MTEPATETLADRLRRLEHDLTNKLSVVIMVLEKDRFKIDKELMVAARASARDALGLVQQIGGLATMAEADSIRKG